MPEEDKTKTQEFVDHLFVKEIGKLRVVKYINHLIVLSRIATKVNGEPLITDKLGSQIKDPKFHTSSEQLIRLIRTVDSHTRENNETNKLKNVLNKFVDEKELIEFISSYEKHLSNNLGEPQIYSKNHDVFGKNITVRLEEGRCINNIAIHIKETRNALVHSTDSYEGSIRHVPFSETTKKILLDIPLMKYLAERVIISSSKPLI